MEVLLKAWRSENAFRLFLADRLLQDGLDQGEVLKGLDLLPQGLDPWEWRQLAKYNPDEARDERGRWASNESGVAGGDERNSVSLDHVNDKQIQDDKAFPYETLRLSDGSTVIGYGGKPISIPTDVSIYDNVKFGECIKYMPVDVRLANMVSLFSPHIGIMDYQRTHSSDKLYNRRYIDFGNFNYGSVAAAAGYSEEDSVRYAGYANQVGAGDKSGKYGGNPRNEVMIRAGWHVYHDGKIPKDSKR